MMHPTDMMEDIEKVLVSAEEIDQRVSEIAAQLSTDYVGKNPLFVGVLKGVIPFFAKVLNEITIPCQMDFMTVTSFEGGVESTGKLTFRKDLDYDIAGRHVVILEDIIDSAHTLTYITKLLWERNPASLKVCTLLDKPSGRKVEMEPDYKCFTIPDGFVVGFGLDYDDYYRNLPCVGILKPEVYSN
ncbi:MAG: hypoxanthine phosphoribosyltransferase [Eubacteriales bacterium]